MVLDKKILRKKLLENDFEKKIHGGISICLEIGLTILKSNKAILEFEDAWFDRFSETLVDIWLPNPRDDEKQKKILESAVSEFTQRGFDGTSLNQIISTAGLSKGSFYIISKIKLIFWLVFWGTLSLPISL